MKRMILSRKVNSVFYSCILKCTTLELPNTLSQLQHIRFCICGSSGQKLYYWNLVNLSYQKAFASKGFHIDNTMQRQEE